MQNTNWRSEQPAIITPQSLPSLGMEQHQLAEHTRLYTFPESEEFYRVVLVFGIGSIHEEKLGINSACAKLILSGSGNWSEKEIREKLDSFGAFVDVEPGMHETKVSLFCLQKQFSSLLAFFAEVLLEASFPEKELDLFKKQRLESFKVNSQKTSFLAKRAFRSTLFGENSNYGKLNSEEDISAWQQADLVKHFKTHYLSGLSQILCNAAIPAQYLEPLKPLFANKAIQHLKWDGEAQVGIKKELNKSGAVQASLALGFVSRNRNDKDFPKLSFLSTVLGGYFGSRLMKNIREEKGFTYGISSVVHQYPDIGYLAIRTDVKDEIKEEAMDEIFKEIQRLSEEVIAPEEFQLVKNYMLGALQRSFDGNLNLMDRYKSCLNFGLKSNYYQEFVASILELDAQELLTFASDEFDPKRFSTVVVGNFE